MCLREVDGLIHDHRRQNRHRHGRRAHGRLTQPDARGGQDPQSPVAEILRVAESRPSAAAERPWGDGTSRRPRECDRAGTGADGRAPTVDGDAADALAADPDTGRRDRHDHRMESARTRSESAASAIGTPDSDCGHGACCRECHQATACRAWSDHRWRWRYVCPSWELDRSATISPSELAGA